MRCVGWARHSIAEAWRFIPAPAGNRVQLHVGERIPRFIPEPDPRAVVARNGSSPRLRGTSLDSTYPRLSPAETRRFIPAPAGNSWIMFRPCRSLAVANPDCDLGWHPAISADCRFIPAPAGNKHLAGSERSWSCASGAYRLGSSPRLRGTARRSSGVRHLGPAVHPRACGEHGGPGSSPRLRGTAILESFDAAVRKNGVYANWFTHAPAGAAMSFVSIPAPAGNNGLARLPHRFDQSVSVHPLITAPARTVHPRACGEHIIIAGGTTKAGYPPPAGNESNLKNSRRRPSR